MRRLQRRNFGAGKKKYIYLAGTIVFLILTLSLIFFFPPNYNFQLGPVDVPIVIPLLFFLSLFLVIGVTLLFNNRKHGLLIGGFVIIYLVLRLFDFRHPLFLFLLVALFLSIELMLSSGRGGKSLKDEN